MQSISSLRVLDDDRENKKLLEKLPDWLIVRWARIVSNWKESRGLFPPFKEFAQFVCNEARIASDPITSLQSVKPSADEGKTRRYANKPERKVNSSRSFHLKATEDSVSKGETVKCHLCQKFHDLDECRQFLNMSLQDRKAFIKDKGLCFACFGNDHISRKCTKRKQCKICSKYHPSSLHGDLKKHGDNFHVDKPDTRQGTPTPSQVGAAFLSNPNACKVSMVVPVLLSHEDRPEKEVLVYAMLDTQSDTTFVLEKSCKALGLKGVDVKLSLSTLYAENKIVDSKKISGLQVRGSGNGLSISLPDVFTRGIMPANRSHIPTPEVAKSLPHLECIAECLFPKQDCDIGLLIGYNCARALIPREIIAPVEDGPFAQRTDLGWGIVGLINDCQVTDELSDSFVRGSCHRVLTCEVPDLLKSKENLMGRKHVHFSFKTKVKEIFDYEKCLKILESDFAESKQENTVSCYDKKFIEIMNNKTTCVGGRYEMPLPFCKGVPLLPNNRDMALKRLNGLKRRFRDDLRYKDHYFAFMKGLIDKGHAERVTSSITNESDGTIWYIPHHGVYHPKKPNKVRVVFDCSAKYCGKSLNENLLTGPDLTNLLVGVLCRFRKENIAFTCDIEQMFYQFNVKPEHRDYLRFLWFEGNDVNSDPVDYRMTVHLFGASSSPGCANFALKKIATDNKEEFGADVNDFVHKNFYVDDGLKSVNTPKTAIDLITNTQTMLAKAGVRLCKFTSNSDEVIEQINPEDRANSVNSNLLDNDIPIERALGVLWCTKSDSLQFQVHLQDRPCTRRGILSTVCSVYDPLGLITPVILSGKQILQSLCASDFGWDDPVPDTVRDQWIVWRESLSRLSELRISRCLKPRDFGNVKSVQLHHFSDASSQGYGQCSYIRLMNQTNQVHCSLLMGKSRVVPLKPMTIPRLELCAALISVRIGTLLGRELGFENVEHFYWTDSKIVLGYISNEAKRFHIFVANRVQEIKDHTKLSQWHHVSSKNNPADIASRGVTARELINSKMWFNGPPFLWKENIQPCSQDIYPLDPDDSEVKRVNALITYSSQYEMSSIIERLRYFSDWQKAKRAVAVCLRYMKRLRDPTMRKPKSAYSLNHVRENLLKNYQPVNIDELQEAENVILKQVQNVSFKQEIEDLKSNKLVGVSQSREEQSSRHKTLRKCSKLYKLDPFIDSSGILRVGGRLDNAQLSDFVKHPILLPKNGHLTDLIARHCHIRTSHQGRGITTNYIRESGYWIVGCSSVVSALISKCVICRRFRGSLQFQKMADLPQDRLELVPPFTYVGVDFFGPWLVRDCRKKLKRYGVIFTCLCCRAVHLETANSLDTSSFVNALRRLIALRGPIRQLRCDRGTNFIGAERELKEAVAEMDENKVNFFLREQGCDYIPFKTNVPSASHMGGIWERQIKSVRNVLSILLRQNGSHLDDESLRTFMAEASAIVNCRPLTVDNLNDPSSPLPLSPNSLLTMKSALVLPPPGNFQKTDLYSRRRWRRVQFLLNEFWKRWKVEFLQNLQLRNKWIAPQRNISVGDVVIIKDENLVRNEWRLGRVVETIVDDDGMVRKVRLMLAEANLDKNGKRVSPCSFLERPIHKLILLLETEEYPIEEPSVN